MQELKLDDPTRYFTYEGTRVEKVPTEYVKQTTKLLFRGKKRFACDFATILRMIKCSLLRDKTVIEIASIRVRSGAVTVAAEDIEIIMKNNVTNVAYVPYGSIVVPRKSSTVEVNLAVYNCSAFHCRAFGDSTTVPTAPLYVWYRHSRVSFNEDEEFSFSFIPTSRITMLRLRNHDIKLKIVDVEKKPTASSAIDAFVPSQELAPVSATRLANVDVTSWYVITSDTKVIYVVMTDNGKSIKGPESLKLLAAVHLL